MCFFSTGQAPERVRALLGGRRGGRGGPEVVLLVVAADLVAVEVDARPLPHAPSTEAIGVVRYVILMMFLLCPLEIPCLLLFSKESLKRIY